VANWTLRSPRAIRSLCFSSKHRAFHVRASVAARSRYIFIRQRCWPSLMPQSSVAFDNARSYFQLGTGARTATPYEGDGSLGQNASRPHQSCGLRLHSCTPLGFPPTKNPQFQRPENNCLPQRISATWVECSHLAMPSS
jgi:hypothetical protein